MHVSPKRSPTSSHPIPSSQARVWINGRRIDLVAYDSPEYRAKEQEIIRKHLAERTKAEVRESIQFATDVTMVMVRHVAHVERDYVKDNRTTPQVLIMCPP